MVVQFALKQKVLMESERFFIAAYPRGREILAPVLIGIAVTGIGRDDVSLAVPNDLARVCGFHSFGVPEHLEELQLAEQLPCAVAHVEGDLLIDLQIPRHLAVLTHPFRVSLGILYFNVTAHLGFSTVAIPRFY